jgi:hypothetical protein
MRFRVARGLAVFVAALVPASAWASFHQAVIDEVMSGIGGDASAQYVEIRKLAADQNMVGNTRLTTFSCDGSVVQVMLLVPAASVLTGGGPRWIMATPSFAAKACITPDFTFTPPGGHPGIFPSCGMVCWGAPGMVPPNPSTWDFTSPDSYVDCVAYGSYTGPVRTGTGTPSALAAGTGTQSLTRTGSTGNTADDFALAAPTPTNNLNQAGTVGVPCAATTTTTTVTTTTVTTTTFPAGAGQRLEGVKLSLKAKATTPEKQAATMVSKDPAITLGDGNGSADDPTIHGGSLRIATAIGDQFDVTFDLPADGWQLVGKPGAGKGYKFRSSGDVKVVIVKRGKQVKAVVKGELGLLLANDPDPVAVVVTTGAERYCTAFGGTVVFDADLKYVAKDAGAPQGCGP